MELTKSLKELFTRTAEASSGSVRRIFMAGVVEKIGTEIGSLWDNLNIVHKHKILFRDGHARAPGGL